MTDQARKNDSATRRKLRGRTRWMRFATQALVHLTGVSFVAAILIWATIGTEHLRWLASMHQAWGDWTLFAEELLIHSLVSALVWVMLFLIGAAVLTKDADATRVVRKARGTVITETLIVFPVLLTLVLGMSQLAVVNIAGMLLNYGAHQAGRAVWLWSPEVNPLNGESARRGVNQARVLDMARIQAAAAIAPVAPADFRADEGEVSSDLFKEMRAVLLAAQLESPPNDSGRDALTSAGDLNNFSTATDLRFFQALDSSSFPERSVRKLTFAYLALELDLVDTGNEVGVVVNYQHKMTFPWVSRIFGSPGSVAGASGVYSTMVREAVFTAQVPPNAELPRR